MTTRSTKKKADRKGQAAKGSGTKTTRRQATSKPKADGDPTRRQQTEPRPPAGDQTPPQPRDDSQEMVVFAFRLTRAERDLIHEAAGSAKASRFVRTLALAAARGDKAATLAALNETREEAH